jgi:hypothetical protein
MANPIKCKYCHVVTLEGFNETERKYYEQGTRQLHTLERCREAKNRPGAGFTPSPNPSQAPQQQQQQQTKSDEIKAAQIERKKQHVEFIKNLQWNTKMLAIVAEQNGGGNAKDILDSIGFEESREDQSEFMNDVV